jgi:hypothetical protein
MADQVNDVLPPYLSFTTFRAAVQNLRAHGLPTKLDRTTWGSRSGAEQGQIWGGFRFLDLMDSAGVPSQRLSALVNAVENSDEEKSQIASLLRAYYERVFELNLKTATPKQLDDAMGLYGVTGATRKRAVRFFIKAAMHSGIPLSTRLTSNLRERAIANGNGESAAENGETPKSTTPRTPRRTTRKRAQIPPGNTGQQTVPNGSAMKTIQLPGVTGSLTISGTFNPFGLMGAERDLVYKIIDMMSEFEKTTASE